MKIHFYNVRTYFLALLLFVGLSAQNSSADFALSISIDQFGSPANNTVTYGIFVGLDTTNVPVTYYEVYSPHSNSYTGVGPGSSFNVFSLPDFNALLNELTNGNWTFIANAGDPSQKIYTFHVTLTNFTTNLFPNIQIFNPTNNAMDVPLNPAFSFIGPVNYSSLNLSLNQGNNYFDSAGLTTSSTNWTSSKTLAPSTAYDFYILYSRDGSSFLSFSTPTTVGSQTLPGWSTTISFNLQDDAKFTTASGLPDHNLAAHYPFDTTSTDPNDPAFLRDTSGNGLNISGPSSFDSTLPQPNPNGVGGTSGVQFDGMNFYQMPTNLLPVIAGSYSLSLWLKTTQVSGSDGDNGYNNPAFVWAGGVGNNLFDSEPMTLTGDKVGFFTGANSYDALHSSTSVNSGAFTHIVVTRDIVTGTKSIYVNGVLDARDTVDNSVLADSTQLLLGLSLYHNGVAGTIDDVQFYRGVLSATNVAFIHSNPGLTVPDTGDATLADALNTTNLAWTTTGDAAWFEETNETFDGVSAAQSGMLMDNQTSVLKTTVTGPGTISFYWETLGEVDNFDLEFDIDGNYGEDIESQTPWQLVDTYAIPAGTHVLTWTASSGDGSSTNDAGYLDEVVFTPDNITPPPTGTWASTGSMLNGRGSFTLTLLNNGKVVAAGGLINGFPSVSISDVDLYNPASGTWTNTGYMNTDRRNHTATLLPNGKILVTGGLSGTLGSDRTTNSSAELYTAASGTWTNTGSMHEARFFHTASLLNNGLVLVAGGTTDGSSELYDPNTQTWTNTGALNVPRFGASAVTLPNGTVLLIGGITNNTAELYDPTTGHWTYANAMLIEQQNATMTLLTNGTVLVAGGTDANGNILNFAEIFDPNSGNWTQTGSLHVPRSSASAIVLTNGVVLVAGGQGTSGILTNAELFSSDSQQWTITGSMLEARYQFPMVVLSSGQALATGGFDATAELYGAAPLRIILTNLTVLANGSFQFGFTNAPGSLNTIFATTNIAASFTAWTNLGTATETSAGNFQFTDSSAGSSTNRFYRVRSP